jgi:DNA topoisomerase VI subunit B
VRSRQGSGPNHGEHDGRPRSADYSGRKKPDVTRRFLQIGANPKRQKVSKSGHKLTRVAFRVSRLMEFCSEREFVNQTGHHIYDWPLVILKELLDNALDACEEAEVAPKIKVGVKVRPDRRVTISIRDNANGFEANTIESILDYSIRVSSREAYVSPTRGAQGNALKTILAMGYVLDREQDDGSINDDAAGVTIIESRGVKHRIQFGVDHINNQPKIKHTRKLSKIKAGTKITIAWPPTREIAQTRFQSLARRYTWFNPHLSLYGVWNGQEFINRAATDPNWEKWRPRNPTSPHWYDESRLRRYLGAHVDRDRNLKRHRTVREFISEFRGLSGTAAQRKVLEEVGCARKSLAEFFGVKKVNRTGIANLLASMRKHSKPVKPKHLGVIGADHFRQRFLEVGGNADTFNYQQRKGIDANGIPYIVEVAFGLHQSALTDGGANSIPSTLITGANWSVGIGNPFRRFGSTGAGLEATLSKVRADSRSVICAMHLAAAHVQYAEFDHSDRRCGATR